MQSAERGEVRAQGEMGRERASGRLAMTEDESGSTVPMFIKSVFTCYSSHISSGIPNESDGGGYGSLGTFAPTELKNDFACHQFARENWDDKVKS